MLMNSYVKQLTAAPKGAAVPAFDELCFGKQIEGPCAAVVYDDGKIRPGVEALQPHLACPAGDIVAARRQQGVPDTDLAAPGFCHHHIVPRIGEHADPTLPVTGGVGNHNTLAGLEKFQHPPGILGALPGQALCLGEGRGKDPHICAEALPGAAAFGQNGALLRGEILSREGLHHHGGAAHAAAVVG